MRIYLVDADGGALHLATSPDGGSQGDASWSHDGKLFAYGLDVRSTLESAYIRMVDPGADWPSWNRDSSAILYRSGDVLKEVSVRTRVIRTIVTLKNEEEDGFMHDIGQTDTGAPIRTLNRDGRQIYDLSLQNY